MNRIESNLLKKEEEFHKLNAELEIKTNELMKEVDSVMKIQDRLSRKKSFCETNLRNCTGLHGSGLDYEHTRPEAREVKKRPNAPHYRPHPSRVGSMGNLRGSITNGKATNNVLEQVERLQDCDIGDIIPDVAQGMGNEALIRFLKAKLRLLQDALDSLRKDYGVQVEECRRLQAEVRRAAEEGERWQTQMRNGKELLIKQEQAASSAVKKLQERENENAALRKEVESLKKEVKQVSQSSGSNEVRLNRALEEVEKLRSALRHAKLEEKELRESSRKRYDELVVSIRRLEKQKGELVIAFKRQLQLIDNLKKQKIHLEASRVLQFTEEDFLKLIDWNLEPKKPKPPNITQNVS